MSEDITRRIHEAEAAYAEFLQKMQELEQARFQILETTMKKIDQKKLEALRKKIHGT